MAGEMKQYECPRCGLTGDHLKSPRFQCLSCCRIDAADDLYAALAELVERRERACREHGIPEHIDGSDGRYARARTAIARARGEKATP